MLINYGINKASRKPHQRTQIHCETHKIDILEVTDDNYDTSFTLIRETIQKKHPGWNVSGWAPSNEFDKKV